MKCTLSLKIPTFAVAFVLSIGGSFSSLRGAVLAIDPSMSMATINTKLATLQPGDTALFAAGTYSAAIRNSIPSGTSAAWITVKAAPGAILRPSGTGGIIELKPGGYVIIDGFVLDGSLGSGSAWGISTSSTVNGAFHHIRIINSEIKNTRSDGISSTGASNVEVLGNSIHHVGAGNPGLSHGIYASTLSHDWLIEGNDIYSSVGYGVQIYDGANTMSSFVVRRNRLHDCENSGIVVGGKNNQIYNNLCYRNKGNGVRVRYSGAQGNLVAYNTCFHNGFGGPHSGSDAAGIHDGGVATTIKDNIVYDNAGGPVACDGCSGQVASNNLTIDPKFVNAGAADFHLQTGSPAIGAGVAISGITTDFDGRTRGNPPSCGAYEGVGGGSTPPPAPTSPDVTQTQPPLSQPPATTQPPVYQPPSTSQPSGPTTAGVAVPFLIAGVIGAALLLGSD